MKNKTERLHIRIEPELKEQLATFCHIENLNISDLVRRLIIEQLKE